MSWANWFLRRPSGRSLAWPPSHVDVHRGARSFSLSPKSSALSRQSVATASYDRSSYSFRRRRAVPCPPNCSSCRRPRAHTLNSTSHPRMPRPRCDRTCCNPRGRTLPAAGAMAVPDFEVARPRAGRPRSISPRALLLLFAAATVPMADAHDHDSTHIEDGQAISADPIDATLWVHIFIQMAAWGVIFPTGMVLGVRINTQSRPREDWRERGCVEEAVEKGLTRMLTPMRCRWSRVDGTSPSSPSASSSRCWASSSATCTAAASS